MLSCDESRLSRANRVPPCENEPRRAYGTVDPPTEKEAAPSRVRASRAEPTQDWAAPSRVRASRAASARSHAHEGNGAGPNAGQHHRQPLHGPSFSIGLASICCCCRFFTLPVSQGMHTAAGRAQTLVMVSTPDSRRSAFYAAVASAEGLGCFASLDPSTACWRSRFGRRCLAARYNLSHLTRLCIPHDFGDLT